MHEGDLTMKISLALFILIALMLSASSCVYPEESSRGYLDYATNRDDAFVKKRMDKIVES